MQILGESTRHTGTHSIRTHKRSIVSGALGAVQTTQTIVDLNRKPKGLVFRLFFRQKMETKHAHSHARV